jgi:prophage DNA circulation protein
MYKADAQEAAPLAARMLTNMLSFTATRGRSGSDFRTAVGQFIADAAKLIQLDQAGAPLLDIFEKGRLAGITQKQMAAARVKVSQETPLSLGATLIQTSLIELALATEARIIAGMTFVSRSDVDAIKAVMDAGFDPMMEIVADDMDQASFIALVQLHAAVSFFLIETARPLPRVLNYEFYETLPSLIIAYRLYADAGRADELRAENKIVHPAFMPRTGIALSS